jgi:type I restriction enzyme S subunit
MKWEVKKLASLCSVFADGDWIESKDQSAEGVRLIQTGNVGCGCFKDRGEKARYISEETFARLRCTEIVQGDCLVSRLPDPVGRACILPDTGEKMITAVDCTIIRFKSSQIVPEFFNYFAQSEKYLQAVEKETTGTTRKRISRSKLGDVEIPAPPLEEQRHIISILNEAFAAIDKAKAAAEKNRQNARELFESYLQGVFANPGEGWEEKTLAEIGITQTGNTPKTSDKANFGNYIAFIKPADVDVRGIGDLRYTNEGLSEQGLNQSRLIAQYSIAMVCIGATIGKVGFADRAITCNQQINTLTPKKDFEAKFFYYAMKTSEFQEKVIMNAGQTTLPIISKGKWEKLSLKYPKSLSEQQSIVTQLDALSAHIQRLQSVYTQKLAALEELKKSILQKAFAGELTQKPIPA